MHPILSIYDIPNGFVANAVFFREHLKSTPLNAAFVFGSNRENLLVGEFMRKLLTLQGLLWILTTPMLIACLSATILIFAVYCIIFFGSQPKMIWTNAGGIVATVKYTETVWNFSYKPHVGESMGSVHPVPVSKIPVSKAALGCGPFPASFSFFNVLQKPLLVFLFGGRLELSSRGFIHGHNHGGNPDIKQGET